MLCNSSRIIFASSDVKFCNEDCFKILDEQFNAGQHYILLENHAVFGITKELVSKIGWFDEKFKAGPHFDPDYMIRASEAGIEVRICSARGSYFHGDTEAETRDRLKKDVKDRLPMNDFYNEDYFKSKWSSSWPGWREAIMRGEIHMPHPPTHRSQVSRNKEEKDWHPGYRWK